MTIITAARKAELDAMSTRDWLVAMAEIHGVGQVSVASAMAVHDDLDATKESMHEVHTASGVDRATATAAAERHRDERALARGKRNLDALNRLRRLAANGIRPFETELAVLGHEQLPQTDAVVREMVRNGVL